MSRGSHRELAINEGKSDEWSSDTTSSFVSTAWCSYCRGLPRTWFDLEAFVSFYYHFWHPCLNLCSGCRRVWRQSERRPEREVWARSFYIIAKRGNPIINLKLAWLIFWMCSMMAYILGRSKRPKSHLKVFKPSTGLTKEDIKSMFKIQWVRDDAFGWPFSWGGSHAIC